MVRVRGSLWDDFWAKVKEDPATGCWVWTAARRVGGYGEFGVARCTVSAHRLAWRILRGPIPSWLELDHLCRNPACVNPKHLELVTHQENILRGDGPRIWAEKQQRKTHCPQGHPYNEENTYWWRGARYCRTCHREQERYRRKYLVAHPLR